MNQKTARAWGFDAGWMSAKASYVRGMNLDELIGEATQNEENARSFTPFEFRASAINKEGERSEGLWSAYDDGVVKGIRAYWRKNGEWEGRV